MKNIDQPNGSKPPEKPYEKISESTLAYFIEGPTILVEDINEVEVGDYIKVYFSFKGGGLNCLNRNQKLIESISNDQNIPEILRSNFGIELNGDKKCFDVCFYLDKGNPDLENFKEKAKEILNKIKREIIE